MSNDIDFTNEQLLGKLAKRCEFVCPNMEATCDYMEDLILAAWNLASEIQPIIDMFSLDQEFHINQKQIDTIQILIDKLRGATPSDYPWRENK